MGLKECWLFLWRPGGRWVDRSMEMRISWSWDSLNIPRGLVTRGWDSKTQEGGAALDPRGSVPGKGWEEPKKVEGDEEAGRRTTFFFLSSSERGLLCPQEPLGPFSLNCRAATQGEVVCLGLECVGKQEVPVISQEGLTVEREPVKTGRPPRWGRKVWPGLKNTWLHIVLWVCEKTRQSTELFCQPT